MVNKVKKIRINFLIPEDLHEFVRNQAESIGVPYSTMYLMIVNQYKEQSNAMKALTQLQETAIKKGE